MEPIVVATTGLPWDIDSTNIIGSPSYQREGTHVAAAESIKSPISAGGRMPTYLMSDRREAASTTEARAGPSPAITSGRPGSGSSVSQALRSKSMPFEVSRRPAYKTPAPACGDGDPGDAGKFGLVSMRSGGMPNPIRNSATNGLTAMYRSTSCHVLACSRIAEAIRLLSIREPL